MASPKFIVRQTGATREQDSIASRILNTYTDNFNRAWVASEKAADEQFKYSVELYKVRSKQIQDRINYLQEQIDKANYAIDRAREGASDGLFGAVKDTTKSSAAASGSGTGSSGAPKFKVDFGTTKDPEGIIKGSGDQDHANFLNLRDELVKQGVPSSVATVVAAYKNSSNPNARIGALDLAFQNVTTKEEAVALQKQIASALARNNVPAGEAIGAMGKQIEIGEKGAVKKPAAPSVKPEDVAKAKKEALTPLEQIQREAVLRRDEYAKKLDEAYTEQGGLEAPSFDNRFERTRDVFNQETGGVVTPRPLATVAESVGFETRRKKDAIDSLKKLGVQDDEADSASQVYLRYVDRGVDPAKAKSVVADLYANKRSDRNATVPPVKQQAAKEQAAPATATAPATSPTTGSEARDEARRKAVGLLPAGVQSIAAPQQDKKPQVKSESQLAIERLLTIDEEEEPVETYKPAKQEPEPAKPEPVKPLDLDEGEGEMTIEGQGASINPDDRDNLKRYGLLGRDGVRTARASRLAKNTSEGKLAQRALDESGGDKQKALAYVDSTVTPGLDTGKAKAIITALGGYRG